MMDPESIASAEQVLGARMRDIFMDAWKTIHAIGGDKESTKIQRAADVLALAIKIIEEK
jgi:hypothetical protein